MPTRAPSGALTVCLLAGAITAGCTTGSPGPASTSAAAPTAGSSAASAASAAASSPGSSTPTLAGTGRAAPLVLRMSGDDVGPGQVDDYILAVTRLSHGSIQITVVDDDAHSGDIDYEREYIQDAEAGRYDLVEVGARAWDLVGVNSFRPMVAPFLIDNYRLEQTVIGSSAADTALAGVSRIGLAGVALIPGEIRHPVGVKKAILTVADLNGLRVGIRPSRTAEQSFLALGAARAEGFPPGSDISGYGAIEQDLNLVAENQYDQSTAATTTNLNLWPRMLTLVMTSTRYARLNPNQQEHIATGRTGVQRRQDRPGPHRGVRSGGPGLRDRLSPPARHARSSGSVPQGRRAGHHRDGRRPGRGVRDRHHPRPGRHTGRQGADAPTCPAPPPNRATPLEGTWQTRSLPKSAWVATATKAGASAAQGAAFFRQLGGGATTTAAISLVFTGAQWTELEQGDDHPPVHGDNGTFTLDGTNLHLKKANSPCYTDFTADLQGHTLTLTFRDVGPPDRSACQHLRVPLTVTSTTAPFTAAAP